MMSQHLLIGHSILRVGLARAAIELRQNIPLILNYTFLPAIALLVMYLLRNYVIVGTGYSLGGYAIPGILAMNVMFSGLMGFATSLMLERHDGTLLRAKSIPHGVAGYLIGKIVSQAAMCIIAFCIILAFAGALFDGLRQNLLAGMGSLLWILPLGLLAMLPFGAVLGSILPGPRYLSYVSILSMGLVSVSGVFYPLSLQASWMQLVGQLFPLYWMGLGLRSAVLPAQVVTAEIGGSWRPGLTILVLSTWSLVGLACALAALRRTARRHDGRRLKLQSRQR